METAGRLNTTATLRQNANQKEMDAFPDHKGNFIAWWAFQFCIFIDNKLTMFTCLVGCCCCLDYF